MRAEKARARRAERASVRDDLRGLLGAYVLSGMDESYVERQYAQIDDYLETLDTAGRAPIAPDRMPAGAYTPHGADEGHTTSWPDLASDLDDRARQAAEHDWWATQPHFDFEVKHGDDATGGRNLRAA